LSYSSLLNTYEINFHKINFTKLILIKLISVFLRSEPLRQSCVDIAGRLLVERLGWSSHVNLLRLKRLIYCIGEISHMGVCGLSTRTSWKILLTMKNQSGLIRNDFSFEFREVQ